MEAVEADLKLIQNVRNCVERLHKVREETFGLTAEEQSDRLRQLVQSCQEKLQATERADRK